jgi:hypothetical protein
MFAWLISHQSVVLFSRNKPATTNEPAIFFLVTNRYRPWATSQLLFSRSLPSLGRSFSPRRSGPRRRRTDAARPPRRSPAPYSLLPHHIRPSALRAAARRPPAPLSLHARRLLLPTGARHGSPADGIWHRARSSLLLAARLALAGGSLSSGASPPCVCACCGGPSLSSGASPLACSPAGCRGASLPCRRCGVHVCVRAVVALALQLIYSLRHAGVTLP